MWSFTDRYSWIPQFTRHPDAPLIFDESYRPKPAYNALVDALNQEEAFISWQLQEISVFFILFHLA